MSFTITTDVFCDYCGNWTHGACCGRVRKRAAWRQAKADGWALLNGKHCCPGCTKKLRAISDEGEGTEGKDG